MREAMVLPVALSAELQGEKLQAAAADVRAHVRSGGTSAEWLQARGLGPENRNELPILQASIEPARRLAERRLRLRRELRVDTRLRVDRLLAEISAALVEMRGWHEAYLRQVLAR